MFIVYVIRQSRRTLLIKALSINVRDLNVSDNAVYSAMLKTFEFQEIHFFQSAAALQRTIGLNR